MALTEFQESKHIRWFEIMDKNMDGVLSRQDWDLLGQNFCAVTGVSSRATEYSDILGIFSAQWRAICRLTEIEDNSEITLVEFLRFSDQVLVSSTDEDYTATMHDHLRAIFDVFDQNSDNRWSLAEWGQAYAVWGVHPFLADQAFQVIDADGDGFIDFSEFCNAVREYQRSNDPQVSGNRLFGARHPV